ncbi:unnamed protein product [marine sediment metagenome]|uniref:Uncharacterized protein n=1 Tax=marine sediment metagenome TaxID=412755 RepID=X1JRY5_9ZZZZ
MKERLIDLIIPLVLIIGSGYLLLSGIDGEVKVILTMAAAWAFRAGLIKRK